MVVNDLDIECIVVLPFKADAPLLVDPDAVLTLAIVINVKR
jgi:hypothetical protein